MSDKIKIFYKLATDLSQYSNSELESLIDDELDKKNPNQDDVDSMLEEINKRKDYEPARETGNTTNHLSAFQRGFGNDVFENRATIH